MKVWVRDYYEVEAESLKEAIDKINEDFVDSIDVSIMWDDIPNIVSVSENGNNPTEEIYDEDNNLVYSNHD